MFCQAWLEKVKGFLLTIYDICFKCQKAACCFQTFTSYKIWFTAMQHKMNIYMVQLFISFCHTYSKQLDTQMAFSLGSKIAVSSCNQLDESQWKLSIFRDAGVRKKTEIYLEGWCNDLFVYHSSLYNQFPKAIHGEYKFKFIHIIFIIFCWMYSCQVLLLDMLSEAFHKELVMASSAQIGLIYSGWTCEYHCTAWSLAYTTWNLHVSVQTTSKHIMSDGH